MNQPKQDIRITKTHKALADTMLDLMGKKIFQKITINDICQQAMVSRSTFYLHFEDKYQLLSFCIGQEKENLLSAMKDTDPRNFIRSLLETVQARENAYRNLLAADIDEELIELFRSHLKDFVSETLEECEQQGAELAGPIALLADYYAGGLAAMILSWIKSDFRYSVEEITSCQYNLLTEILPD